MFKMDYIEQCFPVKAKNIRENGNKGVRSFVEVAHQIAEKMTNGIPKEDISKFIHNVLLPPTKSAVEFFTSSDTDASTIRKTLDKDEVKAVNDLSAANASISKYQSMINGKQHEISSKKSQLDTAEKDLKHIQSGVDSKQDDVRDLEKKLKGYKDRELGINIALGIICPFLLLLKKTIVDKITKTDQIIDKLNDDIRSDRRSISIDEGNIKKRNQEIRDLNHSINSLEKQKSDSIAERTHAEEQKRKITSSLNALTAASAPFKSCVSNFKLLHGNVQNLHDMEKWELIVKSWLAPLEGILTCLEKLSKTQFLTDVEGVKAISSYMKIIQAHIK